VALLLLLILAVGPMIIATDGTGAYSGVKLDAAKNALDADRGSYSPAIGSSVTAQHVDSVEPSPQGTDRQGNRLR
jgi:hypothetical protein